LFAGRSRMDHSSSPSNVVQRATSTHSQIDKKTTTTTASTTVDVHSSFVQMSSTTISLSRQFKHRQFRRRLWNDDTSQATDRLFSSDERRHFRRHFDTDLVCDENLDQESGLDVKSFSVQVSLPRFCANLKSNQSWLAFVF
jgi:hypothetical protein